MKKITLSLALTCLVSFLAIGAKINSNKSDVNSETFTITLLAEPVVGGTVSGEGIFEYGEDVTIVATAFPVYIFLCWLENGEFVSADPYYTFLVENDRTLTALFTVGDTNDNYNISVLADPPEYGIVSGSGNYAYGDEVIISAVPVSSAYEFTSWTVNGTEYSLEPSFLLTVTENVTFVAHFNQIGWDFFTITVLSNPSDCAVAGGGNNFLYGAWATVYALGCNDYDFVNWLEDGEEVYPERVYSFQVTRDRVLVANYERYDLSLVTGNPEYGEVYGAGNFAPGVQTTVTAIPNSGYDFVNWTKNGEIVSTNDAYSFITPLENVELMANFEKSMLSIETIETSSIKIYPNPTKGELKIENIELTIENIVLFDVFGKEMMRINATQKEITIDVSHLSTGIYFLRVNEETFKVVKE